MWCPDTYLLKEMQRYKMTYNRDKFAKYNSLTDFVNQCHFYNKKKKPHDIECMRASSSSYDSINCGHCIEFNEMEYEMYLRSLKDSNSKLYQKEEKQRRRYQKKYQDYM